MNSLSEALRTVRTRISRHKGKGVNEQDTKTALINPILRALGWDVGNLEEVRQEYKRRPRDKPVDYALLLLRTPRLFVEAKALGQNLDDRKWSNQIMGYATVAGVEWVVITNGDEYRIYNALAHVPVEEKLFRSVSVTDQDVPVEETLSLLSKEGLNGNDLEHLWEAHFVDRQMTAVLEGLFSVDPDPSFIRLIRKKLKDLPARDIKASLRRVQATFDFPVDPSTFFGARVSKKPSRKGTKQPTGEQLEKKHAHARVSLTDVIEAGLLRPPVKLTRHYKGHELEAELLANGTVRFQGEIYKTCSQAGDFARRSITGRRMSTNGWTFWQYRDQNGNLVELDTVRQGFLKAQVGQAGEEYSEFWAPIRREGLFAGKPVSLRNEAWIAKTVRGIVLCLQLNNHDCSVVLQFKGEDRKKRRNKAVKLFPARKYTYELHESPKFAYVRFAVLDRGKKDREHWPEIRAKLASLGADIYNRISDSDV